MMNLKKGLIFASILVSVLLIAGIASSVSSVTIEGRVMDWDNGDLISNKDIKVQVLSEGKILDSGTTTTNSSGEYKIDLTADLKKNEFYTVNVSTNENSYVKKEFKWKG